MTSPSKSNPVCQECGAYKKCNIPFMKRDGDIDIKLLVIGESPGETEDEKGIPFVGKAGDKIRGAIKGLDLEEKTSYTNIVRCRPLDNNISKETIEYCKEFAIQDIAETKPEYIFLLGNVPLQAILGETGITNWNGSILRKRLVDIVPEIYNDDTEITIVPLYHPAYILRNMNLQDEWLEAMINVFEPETKSDRYEIVLPKTIEEVMAMQKWLSKCDWISYDTETYSLDAFSDDSVILSVSFAGNGKAFAVPIEHPGTWWDLTNGSPKNSNDAIVVNQIVMDILQEHDGKLIGHNIKYDLMHTISCLGIDVKAGGDSMLISHLLDSKGGIHSLKRLAGIHLGMYEYERELDEYKREHKEVDVDRGGTYANMPLEILLPYGAMDAEATLRLHEKLYSELSKAQKWLYCEVIIPALNVLTHMQCNGIVIDKHMAKRYEMIYLYRREDIYQELVQDKHVRKMIVAHADQKQWEFNPNSTVQLSELYFERYKLKVVGTTDKGNPSTSGDNMKVYEDKYPAVKNVHYYKLLSKMLSTYLSPAANGTWLSDDGRVHTTYNQHGTVTGRLSSSQPNLQNIPTPDKEPGTLLESLPIKNMFTHSYWENGESHGKIVSIDYNAMELRIESSLAKCKPMIKIFEGGKDVHSCVAIMSMTHRKPDNISMEEIQQLSRVARRNYKSVSWTMLYGGDAYTIHEQHNDISMEDAEEMVKIYFDLFPQIKEFGDQCVEFAEDHGYIESPYGRREHLPYINDRDIGRKRMAERQAKNMPAQSAASDTLMLAMIVIDQKLGEGRYKSKLVNTVHDSILLDCPDEEVEEVSKLASWTMENIKSLAPLYFPHISMKWLTCPLQADMEIGDYYGSKIDN